MLDSMMRVTMDAPRTPTEAFIRGQIAELVREIDRADSKPKAKALEADLVKWWGELRAKEPKADWVAA